MSKPPNLITHTDWYSPDRCRCCIYAKEEIWDKEAADYRLVCDKYDVIVHPLAHSCDDLHVENTQ